MTIDSSQDATDDLLFDQRDGVLWVTFNRPDARNAMTWEMYDGLVAACERVEQDRSVKVMVLTGAGGRAFVAGTDVNQFLSFSTEQHVIDYETRIQRVMNAVESVRVPTVAAIAGACTGAGAALASCCDIRIAAPSARFGVPIARTLGNCLPMQNFVRLTALLGAGRMKDLIMRARLMDAPEMLAAGLVSEVTADEDSLPGRAQELALEIAANAPLTLLAA